MTRARFGRFGYLIFKNKEAIESNARILVSRCPTQNNVYFRLFLCCTLRCKERRSVETEGSLPRTQKQAVGPFPEPTEFSPHSYSPFIRA